MENFNHTSWMNHKPVTKANTYHGVFAPIDFPHRTFSSKLLSTYKIYKDAKDFVSIEAETAMKALEASKVEKPYKIERIICSNLDIVDETFLEAKAAVGLLPTEQPKEVLPEQTPPAPTPEPPTQ